MLYNVIYRNNMFEEIVNSYDEAYYLCIDKYGYCDNDELIIEEI